MTYLVHCHSNRRPPWPFANLSRIEDAYSLDIICVHQSCSPQRDFIMGAELCYALLFIAIIRNFKIISKAWQKTMTLLQILFPQ